MTVVSVEQSKAQPLQAPSKVSQALGHYVYCVAEASGPETLPAEGLEGSKIYTVAFQDLSAIVHDCSARFYVSEKAEVMAGWIMAHHRVVDDAWRRWGAVLPLTFNTIIKAEEGSSTESVKGWLAQDYTRLVEKLRGVTGKAEYSIQVSWDTGAISSRVAKANTEIQQMQREVEAGSRGMAYLHRQRLDTLLRREMETLAEGEFRELYSSLSQHSNKVRLDRGRRDQTGRQMLINLSCLTSPEKVPSLQAEVNRISNKEGFFVRLSGPLPPYSFC